MKNQNELDQQIENLRTLQQSYNTLAEASSEQATSTALEEAKQAIINAINTLDVDTSDLAKEVQVKDGDDTTISVSKEIRSEVGTRSDTAEETGTLFAIVKWIKEKVKLLNFLGSPSQGQPNTIFSSIEAVGTDAAAAKTAAERIIIPTDYAKQGSDPTATNSNQMMILNTIATNMYKGVPIVTPQGSGTQANPYILQPNQWNQFSNALSEGDIYFSKGTDIANITNCYMVRFELTANWSGTSVNFEGFSLDWNGGSVPTWTAGHIYEISIVDNIALWTDITSS